MIVSASTASTAHAAEDRHGQAEFGAAHRSTRRGRGEPTASSRAGSRERA